MSAARGLRVYISAKSQAAMVSTNIYHSHAACLIYKAHFTSMMVYNVTATITSWVEHCWCKKLLLMHTLTFDCGLVNMWSGVVSKSLIRNSLRPGTDQKRFCLGIPECLCCIQQKGKGVSKCLQLKSSSVVSKSLIRNSLRLGADHGYTKWLYICRMFCYVFWPGSIAVNLQRSAYLWWNTWLWCRIKCFCVCCNGILPFFFLYIVKRNAVKM